MYDRKEAIYAGRKEETDEFVYKEDVMTNLACRDMVKFVKRRVDLESDRPEDKIAKQWILRHIMTMYLSIQYIRDAAVVLKDVTEVFGLEPHSRYYDPFLNYYCVRGEGRDRRQTTTHNTPQLVVLTEVYLSTTDNMTSNCLTAVA